jgi:hypothetical protein
MPIALKLTRRQVERLKKHLGQTCTDMVLAEIYDRLDRTARSGTDKAQRRSEQVRVIADERPEHPRQHRRRCRP